MIRNIDRNWIILGVVAAMMIAVPWFSLSRQPKAPPERPPLLITKVTAQEIVSIDRLIQKPIFNAERAPLAFADEQMADAEEAMPLEAAPQQAPAPTLVGVVSKRRGKAVAIVKGQDGAAQTLSPGQNIDGWRLVSVGKSSARFASTNGVSSINLDFSNKAIGGPETSSAPNEPDPVENPSE